MKSEEQREILDITSLSELEDPANSGKIIRITKSFNLEGETLSIADGIIIRPAGGIFLNGTFSGEGFTISTETRNRVFASDLKFESRYLKTFYPSWYGALADGVTDDSEALVNSIKVAEKIQLRGSKTYPVSYTHLTLPTTPYV